MSEKEKLLKQASKEFTDKLISCIAYECEYIINKNGFAYILINKNKAHKVDNIAIHISNDRNMSNSGQYDSANINIQTQKDFSDIFRASNSSILLKYKDFIIGVSSYSGYNNTMKQYNYTGEILQNKNKNFVIYDISNIENQLSTNSIPIWIDNKNNIGIEIYPSFLSPLNYENEYLSVEVLDSKALNMVRQSGTELLQWKEDRVRLHLINANTLTAQTVALNIQNLSIDCTDAFGCEDFIKWHTTSEDRQSSFGIISNKATSEIKINYILKTITDKTENYIKKIISQISFEGQEPIQLNIPKGV